jgi:hypothetical protein
MEQGQFANATVSGLFNQGTINHGTPFHSGLKVKHDHPVAAMQ